MIHSTVSAILGLAFLGLILVTKPARAVVDAQDSAALLWASVEFRVQTGDPVSALTLLAELTTLPEQKGLALKRAASLYLDIGNEKQAVALLREAMCVPEHGDAARPLIMLLFKQKDYAGIVAVSQLHPTVTWDAATAERIQLADLAISGAPPPGEITTALPLPRQRQTELALAADAFITQYPPYADDRSVKDTEYSLGMVADISLPWTRRLSLLMHAAGREEWSADNPTAYHAYRAGLLRLGPGLRFVDGSNLDASLLGGLILADAKKYPDIPEPDLAPTWFSDARLAWHWQKLTLKTGYYHDAFSAPDTKGYHLNAVDMPYAGAELQWSPAWSLETQAEAWEFTGKTEDYQSTSLLLHHRPARLPAFVFHYGMRHEFRARDEDILLAGSDWILPLGARHLLLLSLDTSSNTMTHEQELFSQITVNRQQNGHLFQVGVTGRYEFNLDKRYSLTFFIAWH